MRKVRLQQAKGATYTQVRVLRAQPRYLPCLACFSGLFCKDSLVQGHNSCFTFISADTKLAFLSAWSNEQSSYLVGVRHLLRGFPWRLASPNTTTRAADTAWTIVTGRFSLCVPSLFSAEQAGLWLQKDFESAVGSKSTREEGTLAKHISFQGSLTFSAWTQSTWKYICTDVLAL